MFAAVSSVSNVALHRLGSFVDLVCGVGTDSFSRSLVHVSAEYPFVMDVLTDEQLDNLIKESKQRCLKLL